MIKSAIPSTIDGGFSRSLRQQFVECLCWSLPSEGFAGAGVEFGGDVVEVFAGVHGQVGALGEVLAQQAVGVLVGAALPWAVRVGEVDLNAGVDRQLGVLGEFFAAVPGQ